ncbi:MAG: formate dehydrogenase accessory sulfurtransferase FdhD [Dehalococcoidia bacterium]|nr:formate dehydrogenase accessory sulfurtransferase FdhD [Dehalococcoidia bacterium]
MVIEVSRRPPGYETGESQKYHHFANGEWLQIYKELPGELQLSVFVNGQELVTILCSPEKLNCLVTGYLYSEGLIRGLEDIAMMRICLDESLADVRLATGDIKLPAKKVLTSGCGGGISFRSEMDAVPVRSQRCVSASQVMASALLLQQDPDKEAGNGRGRRGVHISALFEDDKIVARAVDIGRHNTLDKVIGECLLKKIPTEDSLLFTTGRISSEMLFKAAKMGVPVIASLNSATQRAVQLGCDLGITLIGYVTAHRLTVFCGEERIVNHDTSF